MTAGTFMHSELTDAWLRVAGSSLLNDALTHAILRLAGATAHLDSTTTLATALGPAAPSVPASCKHNTNIYWMSNAEEVEDRTFTADES